MVSSQTQSPQDSSRVQSLVDDIFDGKPVEKSERPIPSYLEFKKAFWPGYTHTAYQQAIDDVLEKVLLYLRSGGKEGISKAMFFLPPRHGKTKNISRTFPAYAIGAMPDLRIINGSYGSTLAYRSSRAVRNLIKTKRYREMFPDVSVSKDSASVSEWDIDKYEGGLIAVGVGSGVTGHGANLIIIDDPVKSRSEAESQLYRERVKDWYNDDLLTRLEEPGGAIILMMTRWHTDDLAGYLLLEEGNEWHVLRFPALAEENDPLGRQPGEALWPERYPVKILEKRRIRMGEYSFLGLYQQRPISADGALFQTEKIEIVDFPPEVDEIVRFYDLAVTTKTQNDFTAGVKMCRTKDNRFGWLHVYHVQKEAPDVEQGIVQNALMDGPRVRIRLEAEKAGIVQLQYLLRNEKMNQHTIDAVPPVGDKYTRAGPLASRVNGGMTFMVRGDWNQVALDELAVFPKGGRDDIVDGSSGAYELLAEGGDDDWDPVIG